MIHQTTIWTSRDGKHHDEKHDAKAWEKRLDEVDECNRRLKEGERLGTVLGGSCVCQPPILDRVNADTLIRIPRDDHPFGHYRIESLDSSFRVHLSRAVNAVGPIVLGKTELAWYLAHPENAARLLPE